MEFMAAHNRSSQGQSQEIRIMESVSPKESLQGRRRLHKPRIWIDGRVSGKVKNGIGSKGTPFCTEEYAEKRSRPLIVRHQTLVIWRSWLDTALRRNGKIG